MKKLTSLILTLVFLFSFSACGAHSLGKRSMVEGVWNFDNGVSIVFNKDYSGKFYSPSETLIRWEYNRKLDCFDCIKTNTGESFSVTYTGEKESLVLHYNGSNGYRADSVSAGNSYTTSIPASTEVPTTTMPAVTIANVPTTSVPTTFVPTTNTVPTSSIPTTAWTTQPTTHYDATENDESSVGGSSQSDSFNIDDLKLLKLKNSYKAKNGLKVTLNSYTVTETAGYVSHKISYTIKNEVRDSEILPGSFKVYFDDGTAEPQYGFFNYMYYGDELTSEYEWKVLKTKEVLVLEYNPDDSDDGLNGSFFSTVPNPDSLHWAVPGSNNS